MQGVGPEKKVYSYLTLQNGSWSLPFYRFLETPRGILSFSTYALIYIYIYFMMPFQIILIFKF